MEALYAEFLLWYSGFCTNESYEALLNKLFVEQQDNSLLLDLEDLSDKELDIRGRFLRYWNYESPSFDSQAFGKKLFSELESIYRSNVFGIEDFVASCHRLWHNLPDEIDHEDPFYILSYVDDPLSWGSEAQARELCEKAFEFYSEQVQETSRGVQIKELHKHCTNNAIELKNSEKCGCFYCLEIFASDKITEYVDGGRTALCPFCGVDSVIGDASGFPITKELLSDVKKEWFR